MIAKTLSEAAAQSNLVWFTCAGLFIFIAIFVGALVWVYRQESTSLYRAMSQLPLESDRRENS